MGLIKQPNGYYQARLTGADGKVHSLVFPTRRAAQEQLAEWKLEKRDGTLGRNADRNMTVSEFFDEWYRDVSAETAKATQSGWRKTQKQYFRDFISPVIGNFRMRIISPQMIKRIFIEMTAKEKSPQTQRLVYATLKKMLGDAVENYQYLSVNPVLRKLRPQVPILEAAHLNLAQVKLLLQHVEGKKYGLAIWIQLYLGLRVGELIALQWADVDVQAGRIHIRRTFVGKTGLFRDYPS